MNIAAHKDLSGQKFILQTTDSFIDEDCQMWETKPAEHYTWIEIWAPMPSDANVLTYDEEDLSLRRTCPRNWRIL